MPVPFDGPQHTNAPTQAVEAIQLGQTDAQAPGITHDEYSGQTTPGTMVLKKGGGWPAVVTDGAGSYTDVGGKIKVTTFAQTLAAEVIDVASPTTIVVVGIAAQSGHDGLGGAGDLMPTITDVQANDPAPGFVTVQASIGATYQLQTTASLS